MPEQELNNRQFARTLAKLCLYYGMDKLPIVLNSQLYKYFVYELNELNDNPGLKIWNCQNKSLSF